MTPNKIEEFKTALTDNEWSELNVATGVNAVWIIYKQILQNVWWKIAYNSQKNQAIFKTIINPG